MTRRLLLNLFYSIASWMRRGRISLIAVLLSLVFIGVARADTEVSTEPQLPERLEDAGTHFGLTKREYFNITPDGIDPPPNTHTAAVDTNLTVTVSGEVDQTSVTPQTFVVHGAFHGHLVGAFSFSSIVFDPISDFHPGELVETSITTNVIVEGLPLSSPYVWQFRTAVGGGSGLFGDSGQNLGNSWSTEVVLGDLDGDGDLDAFVANGKWPGQANTVWLNDGSGAFVMAQSLGNSGSEAAALGDVDGDGDLDAFVANYFGANKVWLNDGTGAFSNSQSLGGSISHGVALGDVDGDGDLDAFIANWNNQPNKVWLNGGGIQGGTLGTFHDNGQNLGNSTSRDVALGDVDGDGDLDAFVANSYGQPNKVWLNDGTGTFSNSGQTLGNWSSTDIMLGDVDGDGDLDAFVANSYDNANRVWLNDGTGIFGDSGQNLGSSPSRTVALGDVDEDGDLDAFIANWDNQPNKLWLNDGGIQGGTLGIFRDSGQSLGSSDNRGVALGDVDGDGDLDAFIANGGNQANEVWLNQNQDTTPPTVAVTSLSAPQDGFLPSQSVLAFPATVGSQPVTAEVTVSDAVGIDSVTINGIPAVGGPGIWTATDVPLSVGPNAVIATATDTSGNEGQDAVQVTLDLDLDDDGIHNNVDKAPPGPFEPSIKFSDQALGGVTSGRLLDRCVATGSGPQCESEGFDTGVTVEIADAPDPNDGVRAVVSGPAEGFARVKIDGSAGTYDLEPGEYIFTFSSVTLEIIEGKAEVKFSIQDAPVVASVEGTVIFYETIVDGDLVELEVTVVEGTVTINGMMVPPGESFIVPVPVRIDVKPGSDPNCINSDGHGAIPVAVLSGSDFDATQVDPSTVLLDGQRVRATGKGKVQAHEEDVNGDGLDDLVIQIQDREGTYERGDTTATLTGIWLAPVASGGIPIRGSDTICVVPK